MLPYRLALALSFAGLTLAAALPALAQAPEVDRSEVEAKKKAQEEKEKAKAAAVVQESEASRESREAQEHKEHNAKEAVKRFAEASEAARKGQTARALTLLEAAAALDPFRHEFPMNVATVAEALKQPETEFKALSAATILLKRVLGQIGDSPKKPDYEAQLKKAEARMAVLREDGKIATGTIRLFSDPKACEIFLDGVFVGQGEGVIESLTGTRKAETRCIGFYDYEQFVNVRVGDPTSATIKPKPVPYFGKLIVKVDQTDGVITFLDDQPIEQRLADKPTNDGKISGKGTKAEPYQLAARRWIIRFAKEGYDRWHRRVEIRRDETVMVDARLEALADTNDEAPTSATAPTTPKK
jgi:hypothetical protein